MDASSFSCAKCTGTNPSGSNTPAGFCRVCGGELCDDCARSHQSDTELRGHDIMFSRDFPQFASGPDLGKCEKHLPSASGSDPEQLDPVPHGPPQHTGAASTAALPSSANTVAAQMTEIRAVKESFDSNMRLVDAATTVTALRCEFTQHDGVPLMCSPTCASSMQTSVALIPPVLPHLP